MDAPVRDPARAVLDRVLRLTVEKQCFPREARLRRVLASREDVLQRLLDDGRYLSRVLAGDRAGPWPTRVAVTALGHYEAETDLAQRELQGLATTRDRLVTAVERDLFQGRSLELETLHAEVAPNFDLRDFRRWCTVLCSPRLQGRYVGDPVGFAGRADAMGVPSQKTGFFKHLFVWLTFTTWTGLPEREPRRALLFAEDGLRVRTDSRGQITLLFGEDGQVVLGNELGARILAALVGRPGQAVHALDLQAHGSGQMSLDEAPEHDELEVGDCLFNLGIELDTSGYAPEEVARLAAVLRRIDLLESLAPGPSLPKWAHDPEKRKDDLVEEMRASLMAGPLRADFPPVKNAARVVRRALEDALQIEELAAFRDQFVRGERFEFRPKS